MSMEAISKVKVSRAWKKVFVRRIGTGNLHSSQCERLVAEVSLNQPYEGEPSERSLVNAKRRFRGLKEAGGPRRSI